ANDGSYNLTVTFKHGVNLDMAQVMVQNRVALAIPMLPDVLKAVGVTTRKKAPDILLVVALTSPNRQYDQLYLSNYALLQLREELARLPGVGDVNMMGQRDYSMRVWVDPEQLAARNMTAFDVIQALREQNVQVATGQLGQQPAPSGQPFQVTLSALGRLTDPEQFGDVIIKSDSGLATASITPVDSTTTVMLRPNAPAPTRPAPRRAAPSPLLVNAPMGVAPTSAPTTTFTPAPPSSMTPANPEMGQIPVTNSVIATTNSVITDFK